MSWLLLEGCEYEIVKKYWKNIKKVPTKLAWIYLVIIILNIVFLMLTTSWIIMNRHCVESETTPYFLLWNCGFIIYFSFRSVIDQNPLQSLLSFLSIGLTIFSLVWCFQEFHTLSNDCTNTSKLKMTIISAMVIEIIILLLIIFINYFVIPKYSWFKTIVELRQQQQLSQSKKKGSDSNIDNISDDNDDSNNDNSYNNNNRSRRIVLGSTANSMTDITDSYQEAQICYFLYYGTLIMDLQIFFIFWFIVLRKMHYSDAIIPVHCLVMIIELGWIFLGIYGVRRENRQMMKWFLIISCGSFGYVGMYLRQLYITKNAKDHVDVPAFIFLGILASIWRCVVWYCTYLMVIRFNKGIKLLMFPSCDDWGSARHGKTIDNSTMTASYRSFN